MICALYVSVSVSVFVSVSVLVFGVLFLGLVCGKANGTWLGTEK